LQLPKTAFLSSSHISPASVLKCYDWATSTRNNGKCVISGFHSKIEKDVFDFLIKGTQPIIMVLGRAMYKKLPPLYQTAIEQNRLLIVSTSPNLPRTSKESAFKRNQYIVDNANEMVFASLHPDSSLMELYNQQKEANKEIVLL